MGHIDTASRPLCHTAVTQVTTCWGPAQSPAKGMAPGIALCPNASVSKLHTREGSFKTLVRKKKIANYTEYAYANVKQRNITINKGYSFCLLFDLIGQWCYVTAPACLPTLRSRATVERWAQSFATAAWGNVPSLATPHECASWMGSGAAHHHTALV